MSERYLPGRVRFSRLAGLSSVVMAAVMVSTGVAHADGFPLPDGTKVAPGVTLTRTNETANVLPSLANNESRVVYVSGIVTADVTRDVPPGCPSVFPFNYQCPFNGPLNAPGTNNSSTHFSSQINTGYIIGCQVSVAGNAVSLGISASVSVTNIGAGFSVGVNIGPGEVKFVQVQQKDITASGRYTLEYDGTDININGCGGRANARSYSNVEIVGNDYGKYSLYGEPFEIP